MFQVMLDAGLVLTHGTMDIFSSLIEDRRPECALTLLLNLPPDHLNDFLSNPQNSYGNDLGCWGDISAQHQAKQLNQTTPQTSMLKPLTRL